MKTAQFNELLASIQAMDAIVKGKKSPARVTELEALAVKTIREKTGLSQSRFAALIGVSSRTLENWEQGRRQPTGPARALLKIVDKNPVQAMNALHG
jgi:putative transcriptional regulator